MQTKAEFKIIADHLRSSSFLIADGVLPSNEGRGYVLRRIMRRAMRQLHKLGAKEASMYKLVDALIKEMGSAFPELSRARDVIIETLKNEEEKFRETLEKGLKILEEEMRKITGKTIHSTDSREVIKSVSIPGAVAFKLYDTYGFPLDLTQNIVEEKGFIVDLEEFESEMEKQRERARKNWAGSGEVSEEKIFFGLKDQFGETKFLGYETLSTKAKVLAVYPNFIILDQTPFYATSGGQKGDDGKISNIEISETKKFAGGLFVHFFSNQNCALKTGDEVIAQVNQQTRQAKACNHSATHLMHKALKEVLGNSLSQKGSNVDAEYFTFDFNFNRAMTVEEIQKVNDLVNGWISEKSDVSTKKMNLEEARGSGAEALFGEKYDSEVRVVSMGKSVELCGGTHVKNTSEIEEFKIISEKSIASGIRRIEAKTSLGLKDYFTEQLKLSEKLVSDLKEKIAQKNLEVLGLGGNANSDFEKENDPKILEEILKQQGKEIDHLKKQDLLKNLDQLTSEKIHDITLVSHVFADAEAKDIRDMISSAKAKKEFQDSCIFAFFACKDDKVSVCVSVSSNLLEKFDSSKLITPLVEAVGGRGGGGKKDFAMGGGANKDGIPQAITTLKTLVR